MAVPFFDVLVGTRPEAIKLAPLILSLRARGKRPVRVVSSDQHLDLVKPLLSQFGISIDCHLGVMTPNQSLATLSAAILKKMEELYSEGLPAGVFVQGDTTTAFIVALYSFYRRLAVFHVEAGLRTFDRWSPFPEEMNRTLISRLATLHFCPTSPNRESLVREGIPEQDIFVTGNTVVDALRILADRPPPSPLPFAGRFNLDRPFLLVTTHRRENWGGPLTNICRALKTLSANYPILLSLHPNPNVRETVLQEIAGTSITISDSIPYMDFVWLMRRAALILTDSGGIQEEGCALGKQVLVLRETTERSEGIGAGFLELVGSDTEKIVGAALRRLRGEAPLPEGGNPFGTGEASERIVEIINSRFP